jgi:hypothetical protein
MPLRPHCLHSPRQTTRRALQPAGPAAVCTVAASVQSVRGDGGRRSVLERPHRRRAALVATLAMLLTIWLRQVAVAGPVPEQGSQTPFNHGVLIEEWLD